MTEITDMADLRRAVFLSRSISRKIALTNVFVSVQKDIDIDRVRKSAKC